jgi:hypothetical protein
MTYVAGGAGAAAAAAAAIANAIKASGAIVGMEPADFMKIISKADKPLVVMATGGVFKKNYQYLTGYKGMIFSTKSVEPLQFGGNVELVAAKKIWIPGC